MMIPFTLNKIGAIHVENGCSTLRIDPQFRPALEGLDGFSHLAVLWWFDRSDTEADRATRVEPSPYVNGPEQLGVFATRSPRRPNPLAMTVSAILEIQQDAGLVVIDFIDAAHGSPILDLKPYTPSLDRVENPTVPTWCAQWPISREDSATFDWGTVFGA